MRRLIAAALIAGALAVPTHADAASLCPQWHRAARRAGWTRPQIERVDAIMWRESRCQPTVRSTTRDTGLMQINDMHLGWLAGYGIDAADLYRPRANLRAGRLLYDRALAMFACGWQPWNLGGWC